MTSSDYPGGREHERPGHARREGEYEDKDVAPGGPDEVEPVGEYTDTDVTPAEQEVFRGEGEYTDTDVAVDRQEAPPEGSYVDVDTGDAGADRGADVGAD